LLDQTLTIHHCGWRAVLARDGNSVQLDAAPGMTGPWDKGAPSDSQPKPCSWGAVIECLQVGDEVCQSGVTRTMFGRGGHIDRSLRLDCLGLH
jgi:hypothetical protein